MAHSAIYLKNGSLFKTNNIEKKLKKETDSIEILDMKKELYIKELQKYQKNGNMIMI